MQIKIWYDGHLNYKKHTHIIKPEKKHIFITELQDVSTIPYASIHDCFYDILRSRQCKTVEILYSGGLDSECVLVSCLKNNIPVKALTLKLLFKNYPINTHDLYYSTKFCQKFGIKQSIVDLHIDDFFENGDFIKYLSPYLITEPHVATHFWLLEQSTGYPIIGGEYSWPWTNNPILSPHRLEYSCYGKFMVDNSIHGIGNMLNHSMEINTMFIRHHSDIQSRLCLSTDFRNIPIFKNLLLKSMGFGDLELRQRSYGWENVGPNIFDKNKIKQDLINIYGATDSKITWGDIIATCIGGAPASNSKYN